MNRVLVRLAAYVKGRDVAIDKEIKTGYLVGKLVTKAVELIRGVFLVRRLVLVGRGSKISGKSMFFCGRGCEIGPYCLIDAYSKSGLVLSSGSKIGAYSFVSVSGSLGDPGSFINVGRNVAIGEFSHIGGAGGVSIGDDTITGSYLSIHPENHLFSATSVLIREQGVSRDGVAIGKNCWIGAKVTFLDGSGIGDGCVVAAGSVVTKMFDDDVVIAGVPAKVVKRRA